MIIKGDVLLRTVTIDGKLLTPGRSQAVWNHSPDGFNWGYGGSGPSQLALAILLVAYDQQTAVKYHQQFKWDYIAQLPVDADFEFEFFPGEWLSIQKEKELNHERS